MKKWLCCWLACLLALCLTACGGTPDASDAAPTESPDLLDVARGIHARPVEEEQADADAPEAPETSDAPEASDNETPILTAGNADDWESVGLSGMPEALDAAPASETAPTPDAPETSETAPTPDAPEASETAPTLDAPETSETAPTPDAPETAAPEIAESGSYTTAEDVALYLRLYGHLPGNFITKAEARKLGWNGGSLEPYAPGKCIGGDRFGNYEGLLPDGHSYQECDIDALGANSRGAKRLVFSDDGLIYYTADHYNTFTLLYGNE